MRHSAVFLPGLHCLSSTHSIKGLETPKFLDMSVISRYFPRIVRKISQNLLSNAVVIGTLRIKTIINYGIKGIFWLEKCKYYRAKI